MAYSQILVLILISCFYRKLIQQGFHLVLRYINQPLVSLSGYLTYLTYPAI